VHPKRVLRYHAEDLAAEGRLAEAEERYLQALEAPTLPDAPADALDAVTEPRVGGPREDMRIRLELARLWVDQGRLDRAAAELDAIDRDLERDEARMFAMQRESLRGRIEILGEDYEAAFRRLRKMLRVAAPGRAHAAWRDVLRRVQLNAERTAVTEAYALLAIAARETGNDAEFAWALREARDRGVDVSAIE
jgi:tetratricopeptide (TPR) repeat protein